MVSTEAVTVALDNDERRTVEGETTVVRGLLITPWFEYQLDTGEYATCGGHTVTHARTGRMLPAVLWDDDDEGELCVVRIKDRATLHRIVDVASADCDDWTHITGPGHPDVGVMAAHWQAAVKTVWAALPQEKRTELLLGGPVV